MGRLVGSRRVYINPYEQRLMLRVEFNDAMLDVMIPYEQSAVEQVAGLMFNRVKFQAVAGTQFNGNRQMVGRIFYANSIRDFEVVDDILCFVKNEYISLKLFTFGPLIIKFPNLAASNGFCPP